MAQHALFVFTDPVEGKEEEYNDWYNNVHLAEVCQVEGFLSAQRFKVSDVMPGVTDHGYIAIYQVETNDPAKTIKALSAAAHGMNMSDSINLKGTKSSLGEVCSPIVTR